MIGFQPAIGQRLLAKVSRHWPAAGTPGRSRLPGRKGPSAGSKKG